MHQKSGSGRKEGRAAEEHVLEEQPLARAWGPCCEPGVHEAKEPCPLASAQSPCAQDPRDPPLAQGPQLGWGEGRKRPPSPTESSPQSGQPCHQEPGESRRVPSSSSQLQVVLFSFIHVFILKLYSLESRFQSSMRCLGVTQSRLTLCDPVACSPPGSSVHGILQAKILGRVPWQRLAAVCLGIFSLYSY